jgi:predicted O-methyltransferase YrrM
MTQWSAVEAWFDAQLLPADDVLSEAQAASAAAGLPPISIYPAQGAFLQVLARSIGARRILEVGTLGGYSTIWLARALPAGGRLISCEISPDHASVARANLARAGLSAVAEVVVGPAADTLARLVSDREAGREEPFDLVFIDADKPSNAVYLRAAVRLARPGTVIVVDNVVRQGEILADPPDPNSVGVHDLVTAVAAEPRLSATVLQTVSSKKWDGFLVAIVD